MTLVYVLVNLRPGKEKNLIDRVKEEKEVNVLEYHTVYGEYDIILKIEVQNLEDIRRFLLDKIRSLDFVEKTITLIVSE
ncbi:putative HTH-type transcriptional regulator [Nanobdella aerobiophila]|uniref:HTH-type transcriptional regulator n=1 Tax=Nanobdella aerobiophila TaxID=2586965 RepID=A0A915SCT9_9ARCH|nr:Lrp/AsnC ligand binding domain-containing protein [Nanobdella aerobiophila]BBL45658.1 putative HTH-type transcriptional regulator [Nanobdella aerobiophila]